ncbi:MAG: hypothetical protein ABIJ12_00750 [bacterium]
MHNKDNQRIKFTFFSLILLVVFFLPVNCQDSQNDSGWHFPIYDEGCKSLMQAMRQEWSKTDGELTIVFGKKLIWALLLNPNAFYAEFSPDTANYNRFLRNVDNVVFWNPKDTTTSHLERLRLVTLDRLQEQTYSIDSNYVRLHEELIDRIKQVRPTFVD